MWIIYNRKTLAIAGITGHGPRELARKKAIRGVLGAHPSRSLDDFGAIPVPDDERAAEITNAYPAGLSLEATDGQPRIVIEKPRQYWLAIKTDAPDVHPVDGIPEIAADGKATALISLQKIDEERKPVTDPEHNDELFLRTTHGTLLNGSGDGEIARLELEAGKASFRLRSETAKRVATVTIFNANHELHNARVQIEFI